MKDYVWLTTVGADQISQVDCTGAWRLLSTDSPSHHCTPYRRKLIMISVHTTSPHHQITTSPHHITSFSLRQQGKGCDLALPALLSQLGSSNQPVNSQSSGPGHLLCLSWDVTGGEKRTISLFLPISRTVIPSINCSGTPNHMLLWSHQTPLTIWGLSKLCTSDMFWYFLHMLSQTWHCHI